MSWWGSARLPRKSRGLVGAFRGREPAEQPERPSENVADAQFVQSMLHLTITNADIKTSVLVGAIALTFGVGTPALPFSLALESGARPAVVGAVIGIAAMVLCGIAGLHLVLSLRPRMKQSGFSRYSLPDITNASVEELVATRPEDDRREAWLQAKNLADISAQKHAHIRRALMYYPVSVVLMVVAAGIGIVVRSGGG